MSDFDQFYAAYPRKVAKGAARKAWERMARLEPDLLEKCLAALAWQRDCPQWTKDGGDFIPHPSTYLNQERYDDEDPSEAQRAREAALRAEEKARIAERERRAEEWEARKRAAS